MDENRIKGAARNVGGKVQDTVGGLTGDTETQARGKANEALGTAQNTMGSANDTAGDWRESLAQTAKERPLLALLAAVSVGYVLRLLTRSSRR